MIRAPCSVLRAPPEFLPPPSLHYRIWNNARTTLGPLWDHLGTTLGPHWDHFGTTLGQFWDNLGKFWDNFRTIMGNILGPFWDPSYFDLWWPILTFEDLFWHWIEYVFFCTFWYWRGGRRSLEGPSSPPQKLEGWVHFLP